ncbi:dienelactone hydrolase [Sphingomonas sp. G-3-2-10]|uniref:alpha/beta hydrolase family protein n=1 Tax=Sphingomonas sp. G-3-2-10 TaxID=2728838 RepID=UPI001469CBF6|nr:dienelactone hydrolase [Sphingomonas sp. G-3-2-10]NML06289.1 dienelactone hydrolase [Sphingomonas sp. G-3-2-10]
MFLPLLLAVAAPVVCDATWHDAQRNRDVPIRVRMPGGSGKAPVILFSHGLGGSVEAGKAWGIAWAEAGFIVIHLQHPGSDGPAVRDAGAQAAMAPQQLIARVGDVGFAIDEIGKHPRVGACDLARADTTKIGMSGHSFGAHTTQAVAGQRFARGSSIADPRIRAAVAFSPAPPMRGPGTDTDAFGAIAIPFFSLTGGEDEVALTPVKAADRQRPYRAMPAGGKYLLVLDGANHAAFGGQDFSSHGTAPDSHVRPIVIRLTTLFWRWTLMGDAQAKAQLDTGDPALAPRDSFEHH